MASALATIDDGAGNVLGLARTAERSRGVRHGKAGFGLIARRQRDARRDADHAHARRECLREQHGGLAQGGLGQRVREEVRIRIPQLLVEQVDHDAAIVRPTALACRACASSTGAATFVRMQRISASAEKVAALSYSNSDALLTTQRDLAEFVCAFGQQAAYAGLDGEVTVDGDGPSPECLDLDARYRAPRRATWRSAPRCPSRRGRVRARSRDRCGAPRP